LDGGEGRGRGGILPLSPNPFSMKLVPFMFLNGSDGKGECQIELEDLDQLWQLTKSYPLWKYLFNCHRYYAAFIYAAPNLYPEVPAVQIPPGR